MEKFQELSQEEFDKLKDIEKIYYHVSKKVGHEIHELTKRYIRAYDWGNLLRNFVSKYGLDAFVSFENDLRRAIQGYEIVGKTDKRIQAPEL